MENRTGLSDATSSPESGEPFAALLERLGDHPSRTVPMVGSQRAHSRRDASTVVATATAEIQAGVPPPPRPWLSGTASLVVWGGGQWVNREPGLALLYASLEALALAWAYCLAAAWESWARLGWIFFVDETTLRAAVAVAGLAVPAVGMLSISQAYLRAERRPDAQPLVAPPLASCAASIIVPGWGQLLNGQIAKSILFLAVWVYGAYVLSVSQLQPAMWAWVDPTEVRFGAARLTFGSIIALVLAAFAWVIAAYDAALTARNRNASRV
jgi:hypothetical protein